MKNRIPFRRAFGLLQLLVVIAMLSLLAGLLLPAVQKIREASVRSTSSNNIKQLCLSIHNFESAYGRLPPAIGGTPSAGAGVATDEKAKLFHTEQFPYVYLPTHGFLLPYMENEPLFRNMAVAGKSPKGEDVTLYMATANKAKLVKVSYQIAVKSYFSPADPSLTDGKAAKLVVSKSNHSGDFVPKPGEAPSGATSYAANFHLFGLLNKEETKVKSFDFGSTIANIGDGSSNTIAFAEKYGSCTADAAIDGAPTNQGIPVKPAGQGGSLWGEPNLNENAPFFGYPQGGNSTYTTGEGLKFQVKPDPFDKKCNPFRASTPHEGGILVGLADGSVRAISPKISAKTWHQAVAPNDGEKMGDDW